MEEADYEEGVFLAVAIGIMIIVSIVILVAVAYVAFTNWKLKYYTHFYTDNSSLDSSFKRYFFWPGQP